MTDPVSELQKLGQALWLDYLRRGLLGEFERLVRAGLVTGLTSNPAILEEAIVNSSDYTAAIAELAGRGLDAAAIVERLSIEDIRLAADILRPVYERTAGADGYVSLEVAPRYVHDTVATIEAAQRLWRMVARPNLMLKIPATPAGLPAIEQCLAAGLNVNATLIFSPARYAAVIEAYRRALERRLALNQDVDRVAAVASFFVSRLDTLVDRLLDERLQATNGEQAERLRQLKGQAAIANARLAYAVFRREFAGGRFAALARRGARLQRLVWASTSTKNPAYSDVYYMEALIGLGTVNTVPPATLAAYRHHGRPAVRADHDLSGARRLIAELNELGINIDEANH